MKKKLPVVTVAHEEEAARLADLPLEATVALADVAGSIRDGLLAFASATGLVVMHQMMAAELAAPIGTKHAKIRPPIGSATGTGAPRARSSSAGARLHRAPSRPDHQRDRDRARHLEGVQLGRPAQLARRRAHAGRGGHPTPRRRGRAGGAALEGRAKSLSKSAVSRRFVAATTKAMGELMARDLADTDVAVLMIDGLDVAGSCVVVALVITADGTKLPVGLWLGDTENKTVVTALLADLVARGLDVSSGVLCVIDGAKALALSPLSTPITPNFPPRPRLPSPTDPPKELEADHPDAAASLREGLDDMFTVARLGIEGTLAKTLTNTNCIESMISIASAPLDE